MKACILGGLFALSAFTLPISSSLAQVPTPTPTPTPPALPYAVITYPAANPTSQSLSLVSPSAGGIFSLVSLQPNQAVQVTVHYPSKDNLQLVHLDALDAGVVLPPENAAVGSSPQASPSPLPSPLPDPCGGCLPGSAQPATSTSLVTYTDATLNFTFVANSNPGLTRVILRMGSSPPIGLQFWVADPQNPQFNPPAISPDNPEY